jgi:predicted dehydrogenase
MALSKLGSKKNPLRFGLIGAGAIVKHAYLPALRNTSDIVLTSIVDTNIEIIAELSKKYELNYIGPDIAQSLEHIDAVVVAVPNYLHFPICRTFLEAKKHVLCEKPMTTSTETARDLVEFAKKNDVKFAVAHVRRFYPSSQAIWKIIKDRQLDKIVSFDCQEGVIFNWPTTSGFLFDREKAGGGVLMDIGIHLVDLLMWWFDSEPGLLVYEDDSLGGVEAFSRIELTFDNEIRGSIQMSRLSRLRNSYRIMCDKGTIEYDPFDMRRFYVYENDSVSQSRPKIYRATRKKFSLIDAVKAMLQDFCAAVSKNSEPLVTGLEGARVIEFIQKCYKNRQQTRMPWL